MIQKTVLVTGIGGNVGQGIIRNILNTKFAIKIVGTNITEFSAGNHLCDAFYKTSYAWEDKYIGEIIDIVNKEKIDLIIASTDFEIYYLAGNKDKIKCKIAASDPHILGIYLDKYETYLHHKKHNIPFAESVEPSKYKNTFKHIIAKPKKGRGSRGLHFNPTDVSIFSDEEYMIQELHNGIEITTAFYITQQQSLLGHITFERGLVNGATNECRVVFDYDRKMEEIINKMVGVPGIKGSANIQSIVTDNGDIIPFEINCRISGTNSIRSQFGFEDVKYTLQEFLYDEVPSKPVITKGAAVRILMDVIYRGENDFSKLKTNSSDHFIF